MLDDPITDEIRSIRHALAAEQGTDIVRILADARHREASDGRIYVTLPARSVRNSVDTPANRVNPDTIGSPTIG